MSAAASMTPSAMMKTLISLNETSNSRQRAWWEVRGALRVALLLVTAIAITMCLDPELRIAARVTLLEPGAAVLNMTRAWDGWLPLGFAVAAGMLIAAALRRTRAPGQDRGARVLPANA